MNILIVEPSFTAGCPSMKGLVAALPYLKRQGVEVDAWCWNADAGLPVKKVEKLPSPLKWPVVGAFLFGWAAQTKAWWRYSLLGGVRPDLVLSVAWYLPGSDICYVHFSPFDWLERQRHLGMQSWRDAVEWIVTRISVWQAGRFLKRHPEALFLCVSESVKDDLLKVNPKADCRVLPNGYDPRRFNPVRAAQRRGEMRKSLALKDDETVFVFSSAGHYRRKGYFLAVEAVAKLRGKGRAVKLLTIGGHPKRLKALQTVLNLQVPDWREWIVFTGMVSNVEDCYAASDALLFPSYSEAFSLVEIEAAACGLPLFLTQHRGTEMILQEGVNGRLLEFDPEAMARVLDEFVIRAWKPSKVSVGRALENETFEKALLHELQLKLEKKLKQTV